MGKSRDGIQGFERLAVLSIEDGQNRFGLIFDCRTRRILQAPPLAQRSVGRSIDQTIKHYQEQFGAVVESIGALPRIPMHLVAAMVERERLAETENARWFHGDEAESAAAQTTVHRITCDMDEDCAGDCTPVSAV
jgi:hypothetical protein